MSQPASVGSLRIASAAGTDPKARPLSMDTLPLELILYILPFFPLKSLIATRASTPGGVTLHTQHLYLDPRRRRGLESAHAVGLPVTRTARMRLVRH